MDQADICVMSSFVHCMVCFVFPTQDLKFFLSGCGHVACYKCVEKGSMTIKCKVCMKDNPQILEINRNLKPELVELFTPLSDGFSKVARDLTRIIDFQYGHRQRLMRHISQKNDNFEKLQNFCKEEIRKKNQYKQELYRIRTDYKRKCEEAEQLKARLSKMQNCTLNLNDMTHDPFRTPISGKPPDQRSFLTSTPYGRSTDVSESTISGTRQTDSTSSFAAFGIPVVSMDSDGEITKLAHLTSALCRKDETLKNDSCTGTKRIDIAASSDESKGQSFVRPQSKNTVFRDSDKKPPDGSTKVKTMNPPCQTSKAAPVTKKSRLDILSKTQPLPLKSL
ncbi:unnamed protein product [Cylicocyclus nassatus]|uniref:RING-type domain-containing protein n=1 Tax=Cylicocyclus nassatus TaxID=53992 RepID=A0AA36DPA2_CYLNA|nr:unnamed protein product [Cylicocyclus nassatus]